MKRTLGPAQTRKAPFSTLVELLLERRASQPDDLAYVFQQYGVASATRQVTYDELVTRASAIACALQALELEGAPVLLMFAPSLEFVTAYCACLLAGAVGVPLRPSLSAAAQRQMLAICADSRARVVLTSEAYVAPLRESFAGVETLAGTQVLAIETIDSALAARWTAPRVGPESLALLQYTSGSTGAPKGVMVTHANLLANEATICRAFEHDKSSLVVGWLPMFHDMGLIGNVLQPLYVGVPSVLMNPVAFVQKPLRWLQLITQWQATTSGGPDFAYEMCARRISDEDKQSLDLSSWNLAFTGAEPIRRETVRLFSEAFACAGFRSRAFYPCYGLAESTLFVTGIQKGAVTTAVRVDRELLSSGAIAEVSERYERGVDLVCCGRPGTAQTVRIVDPELHTPCDDDQIGEIWLSGPSSARGYWQREELSHEVFSATLAGEASGVRFLRTGDLGFMRNAELYVSGRLKDLIIIRGQNHYPQDIESTASVVHTALSGGSTAAFSVDMDGVENLVLVQEVKPTLVDNAFAKELFERMREAVAREHGIRLADLMLVAPRSVPKTTSGKLQRNLCKALYQRGALRRLNTYQPETGVQL